MCTIHKITRTVAVTRSIRLRTTSKKAAKRLYKLAKGMGFAPISLTKHRTHYVIAGRREEIA